MRRAVGLFGAVWGTIGVSFLVTFAIYRLTPKAITAYEQGLSGVQWAITAAVIIFMAYSEGYRGFQLRFSPRTAARIRYLYDRPSVVRSLLGPVFAMGFFHAAKRTKIIAYGLTFGIIILVILVHMLDQPWRGIIDAGVVVGLGWGVLTLWWCIVRAFTRPDFDASPELPGE
jgi:hypothetical protein